jgi:serine-type D-Ala-D-Ala carboxypeptidase/endopeptidase (penicillin-binding protein 4)
VRRRTLVIGVVLTVSTVLGMDIAGYLPGAIFADRIGSGRAASDASVVFPTAPFPDPSWVLTLPSDAPVPTASGLAVALRSVLADPALGGRIGLAVVAPRGGDLIYGAEPNRAATPASTAKLLTAAAALTVLGPNARLSTTVVDRTGLGRLVLVGGGDPTMTASPPRPGTYPRPAELADLVAGAARALRSTGVVSVTVEVDDSLFPPPAANPAWPSDSVGTVIAPVSALAIDEARQHPTSPPGTSEGDLRWPDPALAAGRQFATRLAATGITVTGAVRRTSTAPAVTTLATAQSAPVSQLVERALETSDNDLAEALGRHVAIASGVPATPRGVVSAVTAAVARLGISTAGLKLVDASGLSNASAVPPRLLAQLLAVAIRRPELTAVLSGLPVAGFTGTLRGRFTGEASSAGGIARAKTGTLTGASALAGVVTTTDGGVLSFAVIADRVPADGTTTARAVLDRIVAVLVSCGCR